MKQQPKKKNRFMAFLTSLCSAKPPADRTDSVNKKKCKLKVNKIPRLTFQLDRALVKVSRKNVAEQEFMENDVLTYHLEKYLVNRFRECDVVVFSGQFSNFLLERIPLSIEIKASKQEVFESNNNYLLSNSNGNIKFKPNSIDALVYQLYFGESENSCKKSENSQQTEETNNNFEVNAELDKIEQILRFNQKKVNNFVFICHKNLKLEDIHNLFLVFKEKYMFEFEKVKKIEKVVCNIVYISTGTRFLRIDDMSLCEFAINQLDKLKAFGQEKNKNSTQSTLKVGGFKGKSETEIKIPNEKSQDQSKSEQQIISLKQLSKRQAFQTLILRMFEKKLHLQVSQALATIVQFPDKKSNKLNWFLELMHERYPQSRDLVQKYRIDPHEQKEEEMNKTSSEFTPIFANRSNNFSKMTALFVTHNSADEDEFILCQDDQYEEMEF